MKKLLFIIILFTPLFVVAQEGYTIVPKSLQDKGFDKVGASSLNQTVTISTTVDNTSDSLLCIKNDSIRLIELYPIDSAIITRISATYSYREENDSLFLDSADIEKKVVWPE